MGGSCVTVPGLHSSGPPRPPPFPTLSGNPGTNVSSASPSAPTTMRAKFPFLVHSRVSSDPNTTSNY